VGADAKSLQDAVLAFVNEHGLVEMRREPMPSGDDKRAAQLMRYALRHMQSWRSAAETYPLARYIGQTTPNPSLGLRNATVSWANGKPA
jgi:hypothetical protein